MVIFWLAVDRPLTAGFTDVTLEAKVDYLQWNALPGNLESMRITGGAAAGDVNGDGFPDLFVTRLDAPDLLFLNDRNGAFVDASISAGFQQSLPTNGASLGDIDNDGDLDLYVTSVGEQRHYLYVNDGAGRFTERGSSPQRGNCHRSKTLRDEQRPG